MLRYLQPSAASDWLAVVTDDILLLVDARSDDSVDEFWAASDGGFQGVLDALTSRGFTATPSFALVDRSSAGSVRVIVRGGVQATIHSSAGLVVLDGSGVSTWTEQFVDGVVACDVAVGNAGGVPRVPLRSGVVFTSHLAFGELAAAEASEVAEPEASTRPEPDVPTEVAEPVGSSEPEAASPLGASAATAAPAASAASADEFGDDAVEATLMSSADAFTPPPTTPTVAAGDDSYEALFGVTTNGGGIGADVVGRPAGADEPEDAQASEATIQSIAGDHDGMTIMTSDLKKLRAERRAQSGAAAAGAPAVTTAPELFLELSNGGTESLAQPVVVGRSPSATQVSGGAIPRLVTIGGDKDISRSHARIAVEGGTVVVTDLHSRNGTLVVLPGKSPQQLRQGEPTSVIVGTVIDLGGGVTLTVREAE